MERSLGPIWLATCLALGVVVAALTLTALKLISTPSGYADRLAAAEQKVARAERLAAMPGDSAAYPKGAVCDGLDAAAFGKARQAIEEAAAAEGLSGAQVAWGSPLDGGGKIAPLPLSLQVEGPYEKVLAFTDRLGRGAPSIFVDTADLAASGGGARLSLSGKVFCWTRG
jgi:hypothetical protein